MSYTFLQEQGEVCSAASFSDIPASVLSRLNLTAAKSCSSDSGMASCPSSQSGMMSEHLMENHGADLSTRSALESPAKKCQSPAMEIMMDSSKPITTVHSSESFTRLEPESSSWKTRQRSLFAVWEDFCGIWPRWGMMLDGECFHAPMPAEFTYESGSGFTLPTTGASEYKGSSSKRFIGSPDFRGAKMSEGLRTCESDPIYLHPLFAELVMMWPPGWTDCTASAMARFPEWLNSHGKR